MTYEMVMIGGINDTPADARAAADLLEGRLAHVNLIPMNPVAHTPWQPSPPERIEEFANVLRDGGLHTTVRRNRGVEIGAACGQLAAELAGAPDARRGRPPPRPAGRPVDGRAPALPPRPMRWRVMAGDR